MGTRLPLMSAIATVLTPAIAARNNARVWLVRRSVPALPHFLAEE